jgi:hypothetical protein
VNLIFKMFNMERQIFQLPFFHILKKTIYKIRLKLAILKLRYVIIILILIIVNRGDKYVEKTL